MNLSEKDIIRFKDGIFYSPDGCWYWTKTINLNGYGIMSLGRKMKSCHRISFFIHNGKLPHNLLVCHACDNTLCVNPNHLFLGTHKDNTQDMVKKGRHMHGFQKTHCKRGHELSTENVYLFGKKRNCKICRRAAGKAYRKRKKI